MPWPPRPDELAEWPIYWRKRWGEIANDFEEQGIPLWEAEQQAYDAVLAMGLPEEEPEPPPPPLEPCGKEAFRCETRTDVWFYVPNPKKKPVQWRVEVPGLKGDVRGVAPRGTVAFSRDHGRTWQDIETGHPTTIN